MTFKQHSWWLLVILMGGVSWVVINVFHHYSHVANFHQDTVTNQVTLSTHPDRFFEQELFFQGVQAVAPNLFQDQPHIYGGVVPHHLVASQLIADLFYRLSLQQPKTIILLGPNHWERGEKPILSSLYGWETPFGVVSSQEEMIQQLRAQGVVDIDEKTVSSDHSLAGLMSFVKYYLPDTKVIPLLISGLMSQTEIDQLTNHLAQIIDNDTVVMSAVDFSHNLISEQAQKNDQLTYELMQTHQYTKLRNLGNQYLDSSPAIIVLLMTMELVGATRSDLLYNTNSGEMQGDYSVGTTSYFSIIYYK